MCRSCTIGGEEARIVDGARYPRHMGYYRRRQFTPLGCILGAFVGIALLIGSIVVFVVIMVVMVGANSTSSYGLGESAIAPPSTVVAASAVDAVGTVL